MNLLARVPLTVLCTGFLLTASDARAGSLDLSEPRSFVCETSAVKLDTEPFEASKGEIVVELQLDDPAKPDGPGRWRAATSSSEHTSSFAVLTKETCEPDCPFNQAKDGSIQLWSPKPMALTQLDDSMTLVLIIFNPTSLVLKASFFRKKQLSGLERGDCKMHEPDATEQGASEQNATEQNGGQPSETEQKE